jgi:hypothetical protein
VKYGGNMGVILLAMTIGGLIVAAILLAVSYFAKLSWLRTFVFGGVTVWLIGYVILLFVASIFSEEQNLGLNQPKEFCGFYLDCHLHTAVLDVRKTKQIGDKTANGEFYVVKVKVFSDAKNPSIALRLLEPKAEVKDENGKIYTRNLEAENELPTAKIPLSQDVKTNEPFEKEIVYDLPIDAKNQRLDISEGYGIDKVIEAVLIGDEDSILHKRNYFKLKEQSQIADVK